MSSFGTVDKLLFLKELSTKDYLTNEDADRLTNMIDELVFGTKAERFVALMQASS